MTSNILFFQKPTDCESRYHSYELKILAIIYALRRFRIFLQGIHFKTLTDCNSLTITLNKKELNPRIACRPTGIMVIETNTLEVVIRQNKNQKLDNGWKC